METPEKYRPQHHKAETALLLFVALILTTFLVMLAGCSGVRTVAERDNTVSFAQYHTFAWLPPDQKELQNSITARNQATMIQNAVDTELEQRNIAADTLAPDLLLRYHIGTQDHTSYHNEPVYGYAPMQPFFWGRRIWYGGGGYYPVYNRTYRTTIREGYLSVDAIDRKTNNVVWRGTSAERVDNLANLSADIGTIAHAMFEQFPVAPALAKK